MVPGGTSRLTPDWRNWHKVGVYVDFNFSEFKRCRTHTLPVLGMVRRPPRLPSVALVLSPGSLDRVWL